MSSTQIVIIDGNIHRLRPNTHKRLDVSGRTKNGRDYIAHIRTNEDGSVLITCKSDIVLDHGIEKAKQISLSLREELSKRTEDIDSLTRDIEGLVPIIKQVDSKEAQETLLSKYQLVGMHERRISELTKTKTITTTITSSQTTYIATLHPGESIEIPLANRYLIIPAQSILICYIGRLLPSPVPKIILETAKSSIVQHLWERHRRLFALNLNLGIIEFDCPPRRQLATYPCPYEIVDGGSAINFERTIYYFGGENVLAFDCITRKWRQEAKMKTPRCHFGAQMINKNSGEIYIMGGINSEGTTLPIVEIYDVKSKTWKKEYTSDMIHACSHFCTTVHNEIIYCFGGRAIGDEVDEVYNSITCYFHETNTWKLSPIEIPRALYGMALHPTKHGNVMLFGGKDQRDNYNRTCFEFDFDMCVWFYTPKLPFEHTISPTSVTINGDIYVGKNEENRGISVYSSLLRTWRTYNNLIFVKISSPTTIALIKCQP